MVKKYIAYGKGLALAGKLAYGAYKGTRSAVKRKANTAKSRARKRRRRKIQRSQRIGTAMFVSHFGWGRPKSRAYKIQSKGTAVNKNLITGEFQLQNSTAGTQAIATGAILYAHLFTPYDIYANIGNAAELGSAKLFLQKGSLTLLGTNQTNTNVFVDIYTVRARKQVAGSYSPYDHWIAGMDNEAGAGTKELTIGCKPTDSSLFRHYWQILHLDSHSLAAGETLKHNMSATPNRTHKIYDTYSLGGQDSNFIGGNYGGINGLTTYLLIVCYGAPYSETTTEDASGVTSTSAVKMVFTFSKRYSFRVFEDNRDSMIVYNNLATSFPGGQHVMEAPTAIEGGYEEA